MIELLFYHGKSLISKAIMFQTRSNVSHVGVRRGDAFIEAWHAPLPHGGVYLDTGENACFNRHSVGTVVDVFRVDESWLSGGCKQEDQIWSCMERQVGSSYDFVSVLRFLSRRDESLRSADRWFCSELIAFGFQEGGLPLLDRISAAYVSPGQLYTSPLLVYKYSLMFKGDHVEQSVNDCMTFRL